MGLRPGTLAVSDFEFRPLLQQLLAARVLGVGFRVQGRVQVVEQCEQKVVKSFTASVLHERREASRGFRCTSRGALSQCGQSKP